MTRNMFLHRAWAFRERQRERCRIQQYLLGIIISNVKSSPREDEGMWVEGQQPNNKKIRKFEQQISRLL